MPYQPRLIKDEKATYQLDDAQKAEYIARLRQKLQDPAFRQIEGFPIGEDEDILALSDPPFYTACPNPFLPEIIAQWQKEREGIRQELGVPADGENGSYQREPFAADVSEGKNNPIYNAHSYHTKVPHKAIMRYILHYTDPGDIVFDGFCGTGMTGVATQLCGDRKEVESLGYVVDEEGLIFEPSNLETPISRLGARKAILNDLSPAATFIAYNYNTSVDVTAFEQEANRILREIEDDLGWMYETWHPHCDDLNRIKARINYTIWSDVFLCSQCDSEIIFWDSAIDPSISGVKEPFACPECGAEHTKRNLERAWQTVFDKVLKKSIRQIKRVPVIINYSIKRKPFNKRLDLEDIKALESIEDMDIPYNLPLSRMPEGDESRRNDRYGMTHVHHFFSSRNLVVASQLWAKISDSKNPLLKYCFTASMRAMMHLSSIKLNYYFNGGGGPITPGIKGTLYVPSLIPEIPVTKSFKSRVKSIRRAWNQLQKFNRIKNQTLITCGASNNLTLLGKEALDYVFIDPPFGANLMYSELNFHWESWLGVTTNQSKEAIINRTQGKALLQYQNLMEDCFRVFYRALKPGRWITVEFHNSKNSVWNSIQEALLRTGFIIADVRTLDKKQGSFQQLSSSSAVKQDLIISAYKLHTIFEENFIKEAGTVDGAWHFIKQHLVQLPVSVESQGIIETLSERQDYLLFDRMVAFHIQRGATVPISASEFYAGLRQRFPERDGMFFLEEQIPQYEQARLQAQDVAQLTLFVSDEKSAIQWLRQLLDPSLGGEPQTYQDIQPQFLRQLHQAKHEALPELRDLLEQSFLQDEVERWFVPDPNKATDLEQLRHRALMREFATYFEGKKKLKQFRTEAVRAGFADAWAKREYATIVQVAERLPEKVLQEDPDLLMYYDNASLRI